MAVGMEGLLRNFLGWSLGVRASRPVVLSAALGTAQGYSLRGWNSGHCPSRRPLPPQLHTPVQLAWA